MKSKLHIVIAALSAFLVACGGSEPTFTAIQVQQATAQATANEAAKADAKLAAAKTEMSRLAEKTARQGGFQSESNCNVMPQGIEKMTAVHDFPVNAITFYKDACAKQVTALNAERAKEKQRNVVAERQRVAKLAAAKAKQVEEAKRVAAAKAKAKPHQQKG
ncbi:MAG: hypothetical protein NTW35_02860 [Candidatus Nomurabacteria bacterium]|nr:hypothetical protein [Candidatus Nomurabacteria bacterium]